MTSLTISSLLLLTAVCFIICVYASPDSDPSGPQTAKYLLDGEGNAVWNPDWTQLQKGGKHDGSKPHSAFLPMAFPTTPSEIDFLKELHPNAMPAGSTEFGLKKFDEVATKLFGDENSGIAQPLLDKFKEYSIPIGVLKKLLVLESFDYICFVIDDSRSMNHHVHTESPDLTVARKELGQPFTSRWTEAYQQIVLMLEILQYVCKPKIVVRFLCRDVTPPSGPGWFSRMFSRRPPSPPPSDVVYDVNDNVIIINPVAKETPNEFFNRAKCVIRRQFRKPPTGECTPMLETLSKLLARYEEERVAFYVFCDGEPTDGYHSTEYLANQIEALIQHRRDPESHPFTLVSCSDDDANIAWMKTTEARSPNTAEIDDFRSEAAEVVKNQGWFFPYTRGLYIISLLVAAMNPDDLDALDEAVPMTKHSLECLFGITYSDSTYLYYFYGVVQAQETHNYVDMKTIAVNYDLFLQPGRVARDLPFVQRFRLSQPDLRTNPNDKSARPRLRREPFRRAQAAFIGPDGRQYRAMPGYNPYGSRVWSADIAASGKPMEYGSVHSRSRPRGNPCSIL